MPLTVTFPGRDLYDQESGKFITIEKTMVTLEHSLISVAKWESKWKRSYFIKEPMTLEQSIDYISCMCLTKNIDPKIFRTMDKETAQKISDYIADPMTATTINRRNKRPSRKIITNEVIYFWMCNFGIPFDPCQKWHLNRLMTLIDVAAAEEAGEQKMPRREMLQQRAMLNAQRKAKYNTHG